MSLVGKCLLKSFSSQNNIMIKVFRRNYPAPVKRFYRKVHVSESDGKYEIILDKRKLKTPLRSLFQLPNEGLAVAVATEWDLQKDIIQQHNMHVTALCNTALDNPCRDTVETLADNMLQYLVSDTLCFRSNEPPEFAELQKDAWDPILKWFQSRYNVKINVCEDVSSSPVPDQTVEELRKHLLSYNKWCLIGINFTTENLKSLILALALVNHVLNVDQAVELSRLETTFQVKHWGKVEWSHSVDEAQIKARTAAGALFTYLNEESTDFIKEHFSKELQNKKELKN